VQLQSAAGQKCIHNNIKKEKGVQHDIKGT